MLNPKLYLIPTPLDEKALECIPAYAVGIIHSLTYFVVERAKTARHFIKATNPPYPISDLQIMELNEHTPSEEVEALLKPLLEGYSVGLMSEAGCPGVADPGAALVAWAHKKGIEVVPLVGPSSILLALMASGLNGQQFCFNGYLSAKRQDLDKDLRRLEQLARKGSGTQIFIETPYRNQALLEQSLLSLASDTKLCIAVDITGANESILTKTIVQWKKIGLQDLHKRPAIFLIGI